MGQRQLARPTIATPVCACKVRPFRGRIPGRSLQQRARAASEDDDVLLKTAASLNLPLESEVDAANFIPAAAAATATAPLRPNALEPGVLLKVRYRVAEALGAGSNAITYRATDESSGAAVAIKALSLKGLRDWKQLELFQREAQVLQSLSHPSIPQYIDYIEQDSASDRSFYLVQEVAQGRSLADMLSDGMRAPNEAEVLRISKELLDVLAYLGGLRPAVVHRDIKPENVILEGGAWGGRVFLIDFGGVQGAATPGGPGGLGSSTIVGSYGYMAPEQFRGAASPASDLYALGATLLHLATGRPPWDFPQERMRTSWKDSVRLGPALSELLDGLLEPQAEDRLDVEEAADIASGRAARRRQRAAARRRDTGAAMAGGTIVQLPDGRVYTVPGTAATPARPAAPPRKPAGTRVKLSRDIGRLDIEIPPAPLSAGAGPAAAFALVWNAFVAFWTISALASGGVLFALFSAPFWAAGVQLAGQAVGGALTRERFAVGRRYFQLAQELAMLESKGDGGSGGSSIGRFLGRSDGAVRGETEELSGARLVTTVVVNGVPRYAVEVVEGVNKYRFAEGLERPEQEWLVWEINTFLEQLRGASPDLDALPPADAPKVVDDGDAGVSGGFRTDPFADMRDDDNDRFFRR